MQMFVFQGLVGQNTWLQIQFIGLLGKYTDLDTVAHWALRLNVPQEKLPQPVAKWLKQLEKDKGYVFQYFSNTYFNTSSC